MKLEVGKYYKTRDGRKFGPCQDKPSSATGYDYIVNGLCYFADGTFGFGANCRSETNDLIAELTDEPASILSAETIDMIAIDSLKHHADKDMEPLQREAFRIVLRYYGVTL